jgi:DNA-directed RNA polymerase subunit RPC12/RpoP
MRSAALTALLIIVIIAAGVRLVWYFGSRPKPGEPVAHLMPVACAACGETYADTIGSQPAKCRFCGAKAVWRAVQCRDCGTVFPLIRDPSQPDPTDLGRCPKCGSRRTGEVDPDAIREP